MILTQSKWYYPMFHLDVNVVLLVAEEWNTKYYIPHIRHYMPIL